MKNKKNIYILLPIVTLIWGILIFQFFSFTTPEESSRNASPVFNLKPLKIKERKSFTVDVDYRDPFLGKMYNEQKVSKVKSVAKIKREPKRQEEIIWPTIVYKGMISDSKQKNKLFILVIADKNYFMKIGDTENDIFLKEGDKESVYVKYKGNLNLIMLAE